MNRRGGGAITSANTVSPSSVSTWLRPRRIAAGASAPRPPGSSPTVVPSSRTSSFAPIRSPATTVSTTARPPSSTMRRSSSNSIPAPAPAEPVPPLSGSVKPTPPSLERLDEHVDLAAARQADSQRHVVGDPVRDQARRPAGEDLLRGEVDVALDAAAGDRARKLAARRDHELRADRTRRRAPGRDDGRDRDLLPLRPPAVDVGKQF